MPFVQVWKANVLPGYSCPGQITFQGALSIEQATYVNPPWYFYLPTGSITVEATWTQVTVATLKPQTAYVVYISSL